MPSGVSFHRIYITKFKTLTRTFVLNYLAGAWRCYHIANLGAHTIDGTNIGVARNCAR